MSKTYLVQEDSLVNIANAIRTKSNTSATMTPDEMASAISGLSTKAILTFSTSHGTAPSNIGAKYTKPTNPTATGYTFVNWYKDSTLTTLFDFDAVAEGANVYAKWSIDAPTVSNTNIKADGTSYPLGEVTPAGSGQTVYYSSDNSSWSTTCPEKSDIGTYTTYWKITATDCDDLAGSFVTIIKKFELIYYGTATELSQSRAALAATSVGDYALFGGGIKDGSYYNVVDAYNSSLTRSTPTVLSVGRNDLAATSVGDYALFGGGYTGSYSSIVNAYNSSLTRSTPTTLSESRCDLAATSVGNYALFGGGRYSSTSSRSSVVDAYNSSLTRSTPTVLSVGRNNLAATSVGDYALFGGGSELQYTSFGGGMYVSIDSSVVDAYNSSLTRSTPTTLSESRCMLAATSVGNYALFGGGGSYSVVDAYNSSLTRSTPTTLSAGRNKLAATSVGDYALFGGGGNSSSVVDAYNSSLTRSTPTALSGGKYGLAATSVGDYALFGGGYSYGATVDVYIVD